MRLNAFLDAIQAGAEAGMKDHDRWLLARRHLEGKLKTRRSSSRLPALVEFILARPIASAGMIAAALGVTPRAAQAMVAELGLREITGRGRYRAWGILRDFFSCEQPGRCCLGTIFANLFGGSSHWTATAFHPHPRSPSFRFDYKAH